YNILGGELTSQARASLVSQIDAHASFQAIATSDPGDASGISFLVLNADGTTVTSLAIRETDANMQNGGSFFTAGATTATLRRPSLQTSPATLTAGIYRLMIDLWDDPDFDHTFATGPSAIATSAALETAIISELTTAGFGVATGATTITITRPGDKIMAIRVDSEGSGLIENSYGISGAMSITPAQPVGGGVPTLSQYGMFALILLMTAAAFVIMRRKSAAAR
ncbi:MAG TPA: hypothetical protein VFP98_06915, partial [Candidatus Polarisedimenticolia bacterium]|nr:hypothetical protein [Candidatus Polarisedimenticolia bacterium]